MSIAAALIQNGVVINKVAANPEEIGPNIVPIVGACEVGYLWDGSNFTKPELTPEQLFALKVKKNDEINAARLKANFSTFTHAGKTFACDTLSRSDIDGINGYVALVGDLPAGWPGGWKAVDNTIHPIADVTAWGAFYASMVAAGNANFGKSQVLKVQLEAASTEDQINSVQW